MPESPKIVAAAEAVFAKLKPGQAKVITVPWEDFVFSVRDGRPYMPPALEEGLRRVMRKDKNIRGEIASPKGVRLRLRRTPAKDGFPGMFTAAPWGWMFYLLEVRDSPRWRDTLRHELLHLTQETGSDLIAAGRGEKSFPRTDASTTDFGFPKKKLRTYDPAELSHGVGVPIDLGVSMHARGDVEHFAVALTAGLSAARSFTKKPTSEQLAEAVYNETTERTALFDAEDVEAHGLSELLSGSKSPGRAREITFVRSAWDYATRELGMPGDVTPEVSRILGVPVQKSRSTVVPRRTVKPSEASKPQQPEQQEILYTKTGQPYTKVGGKVRFLPRTAR
jgi:hypothetical protein